MWPDGIVVAPPVLNQHLCLAKCREDLPIQEFVSEFRVQALAVAILPWTSRLDIERPDADPAQPLPHADRDELGTVVGANVLRWAVGDEEIGQTVEHVVGSKPSGNHDRQAPARELVEHHEHAEGATVLCPILDEVIGPNVVRPLRSQTDA